MTLAPSQVNMERTDPNQSWGFRLQGGVDFRERLSIKKVTPNTPAATVQLRPGDAIISIGGYDAQQLTHNQASQMIKSAGYMLQMTVDKGACSTIKPGGFGFKTKSSIIA